jgi:hypothetical protein
MAGWKPLQESGPRSHHTVPVYSQLRSQHRSNDNHRVGKGRGETARMSLPSQLERTSQLSWWRLHGVCQLLCPSKIFRHGNKKTLFLGRVYSALHVYLISYLKLWTYFKINMWHKFSCLAMAFVCSPYHRGSTQNSGMAWHVDINITKFKEQRQL